MTIFIPHSPFEVKLAFGEFPIPQTKMFDGELEALGFPDFSKKFIKSKSRFPIQRAFEFML